jgi:hypothetical protein
MSWIEGLSWIQEMLQIYVAHELSHSLSFFLEQKNPQHTYTHPGNKKKVIWS